jgi:hypothetical protein
MKIRTRARGLTFLEVAIASALLTVVLLVGLQGTATMEVTVTDTHDRIIAENTANNMMQFLLECLWFDNYDNSTASGTYPNGYGPGILNYFHQANGNTARTVKLSPTGSAVFGTYTNFSVPVPGYPLPAPQGPGNTLGTFWVTEATQAECPGYSATPRFNGNFLSYVVPLQLLPNGTASQTLKLVPYTESQGNAPTVLSIIVQVNIPPFPSGQTPYPGQYPTISVNNGRQPTLIQLQCLRSSL